MDTQKQLFRLSAVLYADNNNYGVNIKTIYRKIIESALLEINKQDCSIHEMIQFICDNYNLIIDENTVKEIIKNNTDKFDSALRKGEQFICLTGKRKLQIERKIKEKDIDFFIQEFEKLYSQFSGSKDIIYKFLYDIFITNTEGFKKLFNKHSEIKDLFNLDNGNYNDKEKEIINNFLFWENSDKNKAIFDLSSYALEYCMLTNKEGGTSIELKELKHKNFYLDTNIIYRGLGINGDNRKERTRTFLRKFIDAEEILKISRATDKEFRDSIKIHISKINAYNSPRIKSDLFQSFKVQQDMYNFYHTWRCGKVNTSVEMFHAEILRLYAELKKEFKIDYEGNEPYDKKDKNETEKLDLYASEINTYKGGDSLDKADFDAENILWVETKRNGNAENIFDTKYFLISTDHGLRNWDYYRKNSTPIVLLPSQWMTIVLRYFHCTNDDYKSFISFLNLKNNEKLLDGENLHIILAGISEMTGNIEHQKTILNHLIENSFNTVVKRDSTPNQIFENSKAIAKTELERLVENQQGDIQDLSNKNKEIEDKFNQANEKIDIILASNNEKNKLIEQKVSELQDDLKGFKEITENAENENEQLKQRLRDFYLKEEIRKWRTPAKWSIPISLILLLILFFQLFFRENEYNIVTKIITWVDNTPSETTKSLLIGLNILILTGLSATSKFIYERLISEGSKKNKEKEIKGSDEYKAI